MRRRTIVMLALTAPITLVGCTRGSDSPSDGEGADPSDPQSESTEGTFNGTDLTVIVESDGTVTWSTYAKDGPARGEILVEVGDWSTTSTETVGKATPQVSVGTYTGTVTYTNPEGGVIAKDFAYELEKAYPTMTIVSQEPMDVRPGEPVTFEIKIEGNALLTGTVTATETVSKTEIASTEVGEDGIALVTFTPEEDGGTINVRFSYSGDENNNPEVKTQTITLRP